MNSKKELSIQEHFLSLNDPRQAHKIAHPLMDFIIVTICAVISGADSWVDVQSFGRSKEKWLKTFLELPNGIPSHDTLGRVFSLIDPEELEKCFQSWIAAISEQVKGVVAIDGKTVRRSFDRATGKNAIHMISAWASNAGLVLGQLKTDAKSNEITAIPKLLELLTLKGCIVTIDAMGCQKEIAEKIVEQEADYILAIKRNQPGLYDEVYEYVQKAHESDFEGLKWSQDKTENRSHGRHEIRRYWTIEINRKLERADEWPQLNTIGMVESICQTSNQEETREYRFYLTSLKGEAKQFAQAVRSHWGIENSLHWVLDVAFREDESRVRIGKATENFSLIRRLALNLLKQESTVKTGVKAKRLRTGWDEDYFLKVLTS